MPEAAAVDQVSTVESKVTVLQEGSRGSAPGSVREDRNRLSSRKQRRSQRSSSEQRWFTDAVWSASRLRSGGGCLGVSWLVALCKQCPFDPALVNMFDLTLWLDVGFGGEEVSLAMLCLRRSRTTHQDRHVVCKTHCFLDSS